MISLKVTMHDNGHHDVKIDLMEPSDTQKGVWEKVGYENATPLAPETIQKLRNTSGGSTGFLAGCGWDHPPRPADEFIGMLAEIIPHVSGYQPAVKEVVGAPTGYKILEEGCGTPPPDKEGQILLTWGTPPACDWAIWIPVDQPHAEEDEESGREILHDSASFVVGLPTHGELEITPAYRVDLDGVVNVATALQWWKNSPLLLDTEQMVEICVTLQVGYAILEPGKYVVTCRG